MRRALTLLLPVLLGGCEIERGGNPLFRNSGEVIAMGGGDGGAGQACISCHGLRGEGDGRLAPRLAGLDPGYLHRQLDDYANGRREHTAMRAIVRRLSGTDRAKVAAYYAALPAPAPLGEVSALYAAKCAECHGARGEGMGPGNPPLAGQSPAYVAAQIDAWRAGKRRDPGGEMLAVSRALSPQELRLLASHGAAPRPAGDPRPVRAASR